MTTMAVTIEEGKNAPNDSRFWQILGGKPDTLKSEEEGGDDGEFEKFYEQNLILSKVVQSTEGQLDLVQLDSQKYAS